MDIVYVGYDDMPLPMPVPKPVMPPRSRFPPQDRITLPRPETKKEIDERGRRLRERTLLFIESYQKFNP